MATFSRIDNNTWALETPGAVIPFYRLGEKEILLFDTGSEADRPVLAEFLQETGFIPLHIFTTHTHFDHTGSNAWLKERYGCKITAPAGEAVFGLDSRSYRGNYQQFTPVESEHVFSGAAYEADQLILPGQTQIELCGQLFSLLPLPGHTMWQTGIITPDGVAYLADALISPPLLRKMKLPTGMDRALERRTREALRALDCRAYVLAHHEVTCCIANIIDENDAAAERCASVLLETLDRELTHNEWLSAVYDRMEMRSTRAMTCVMIERNFSSFVDDLVDCGKVELTRKHGVRCYSPR